MHFFTVSLFLLLRLVANMWWWFGIVVVLVKEALRRRQAIYRYEQQKVWNNTVACLVWSRHCAKVVGLPGR
jgi:hypothetical protein